MRISIIFFVSYGLFHGCSTSAQEKDVEEYFLRKITNITEANIQNQIIKESKCVFNIPTESGDPLVKLSRIYFLRDKNELDKYCDQGCTIETNYEVKSYEPSQYISILQKKYFECPSMPSPSRSSRSINFIKFDGEIYEVQFNWNEEIRKYLNTLVVKNYETDCIENGSLNEDLDLYIQNGMFYINNPLHKEYCDEPLHVPNVIGKLKFIKVD